jgi:hypothetical protein
VHRSDLVAAAVLAIAAVAAHGPLLALGLNLPDEGYQLYGAARMVDGQVPYRDFERIYPPGVFEVLVPIVRARGPDVVAVRAVWLAGLVALSIGIYTESRRWAPRALAFCAGLAPLALPPPAYKTWVPLCWLAAASICAGLARAPIRPVRLVRAGAWLGVVALFRHDVAAFGALVAAATCVARGPRAPRDTLVSCASLAAGASAVLLPVLAVFAARGAAGAMLHQLFVVGPRENADTAIGLAGWWQAASRSGWIGASALAWPTIALVASLAGLARRRSIDPAAAAWTALLGLAHLHWLEWPDLPHLAQLLPLPLLLTVHGCARLARAGSTRARIALAAVGAWTLLVVGWSLGTSVLPLWRERSHLVSLRGAIPAVRVAPRFARQVDRLVDEIVARTAPREPIFVAPYAPMLYLLADRPNPTRFDLLFPGQLDAAVERELIDALDRAGVRLVAVDDHAWGDRDELRVTRFAPAFAAWLDARFRVAAHVSGWTIHERIEAAPR